MKKTLTLTKILVEVCLKKLLLLAVTLVFLALSSQDALGQACDSTTPTFTVNLSGDPDSVWTSTAVQRQGLCCTFLNPFNCIEFNLTLDSASEGIRLDIISGALPGGSLFYQFSCGDTGYIGDDICLSGPGPHRITFCKPGNNINVYQITAIPKPTISGDIVVSDACVDSIYSTGLEESTIKWRSVPNNPTYDSFLVCDTGCDSTVVVPFGTPLPEFVDYEVCGDVIGGCSQLDFCDTTRVYLVTTTGVDIIPDSPTICFGNLTTDIVASPTGGKSPFFYRWSTGDTNTSMAASDPLAVDTGTYWVEMTDSLGCVLSTDTVVVTEYLVPILAIPHDTSMCRNVTSTGIYGEVQAATGGVWSGGNGTFDDSASLSTVYHPTTAEIASGSVTLYLTTTGNGTCPAHMDSMTITFTYPPTTIITGADSTCEYENETYSLNKVPGSNASWSAAGGTIIGSDSSSSVIVQWGASGAGTLTVTHTDSLGCDSVVNLPVTILPKPTPVIAGDDSTCEYRTYTYSTPNTSGNTYSWTVIGGLIIGPANTNSINVFWGATGGGLVSVTETNAVGCDSTASQINVTVLPTPTPVISGNDTVCEYQDYVYTTTNNAGNTYQWNVTGGTILGSSTSNSVTVSWGTNGTGSISVTETNTFGCDSTYTISGVLIQTKPTPVIAGLDTVCEYQQYTYSTTAVGGDTYQWLVTGGTIVGSSTSNSVTIAWSTTGTGSLTLTQTRGLCDSTVSIPGVVIQPTPTPSITGLDTVCEYQEYSYSTLLNPGNTYQWVVSGGTIQGSSTGNSVIVNWSTTGTGSISVTETNPEGCDSTVSNTGIVILPKPTPVISGSDSVCEYQSYVYSTTNNAGNTYQWSVSGGTILGSSTSNSVTVNWSTTGTGTITLTESTGSCDSTVSNTGIVILPKPTPVISGSDSVCEYQSYVYSTTNNAGNTYQWMVTGGTILGSSTNNSVTVSWSTTGTGTITLTETNSFGCDSTVSNTGIVIMPKPTPVLAGDDTTCAYQTYTYSTTNNPGNTYTWIVAGGTIVGASNTNSVDIRWGASGSGAVSLTETTPFGCDSTVVISSILIRPTPVPVLTGSDTVCEYQTYSYFTPFVVGHTYSWNIVGGNITGSSTGNSVNVRWSGTGTGSVTVTQTNQFGCDSTVSINGIAILPTPTPVISGLDTVCEYQEYTYSTTNVPGNTYSWVISGGTILGSATNSSVTVNWSTTGTGTLTLTETSGDGCDSTVSLPNVVIQPKPVPVLSGSDTTCEYQTYIYSTPNVVGDTYAWSVSGGTIIGSSTGNSISVSWGATGTGSVQVTQTNPEGCDSIVAITGIVIQPTPVPVLSGSDTVCEYRTYIYSTPNVVGDSYSWSITGGFIVGPSIGSTVNVRWNGTGTGIVQVTQTNAAGCDSTVSISGIVIQPTPVPVLSGSDTTCEYQTYTYSTPNVIGDTYNWVVSGGAIVGASTGNSINVRWDATGTGSVTVTQTNTEGCDSTVAITGIVIQPTPVPVLSGSDTTCEYQTYIYSTPNVVGDTYSWNITGGTIVGATTGNSVSVRWGATGTGSVSVTQTNPEGCDSTVAITGIVIQPTPVPVISGSDTTCEYQTYTYTTPFVASDTYSWSVSGGAIIGSSTSNSVNIRWDATGTGSVTLTQTNPEGCDSTVSLNGIVIQPTPVPVISGSDSVCEYQSYVYSTPNVVGDTYAWSVSGGTILGPSNTNSVTISWSSTGTGSVSLTQTNPEGCDSTVSLNGIVILPKPTPVISGLDTVCEYQAYTYLTTNNPGNTYQWVVTGGTILGSSTTNSVLVSWSTTGTGSISVTETSPAGCDSTVSNTGIVIQPKPVPVIAGDDTTCEFQQFVYTVPNVVGDTYQWTANGGTIVGSSTNNSVNVSWGAQGTGSVTLNQTNPEGCDSSVTMTIFINAVPQPVISGPDTACEYRIVTYSTPNVVFDTYLWAVTGGTIVGSNTNNSVDVLWGPNGSGNISVTQTNAEGCDSTVGVSSGIHIEPTPVPVLSGNDTVCEYQTYTYTTPFVAADSYSWNISGGVIVGASTGNSVNVRWDATGTGSVSVTQTNPEGCDSTVAINGIVIQPTPVPVLSGNDTVCEYQTYVYSTPNVAGDTYAWSVSGGVIVGATNTNTISVRWDATGTGSVSVTQTNPEGCDSTVAINGIVIQPTPVPVLSGSDTTCEYQTYTYTTPFVAGDTYNWSISGGAIVGASTGNSVNVRWDATGTGSVSVTQTNPEGCDSTVAINGIVIQPTPVPVLSGNDTVCEYQTYVYSTPNVAGDTYAWSVSDGVIVGATNTNTISVRWDATGTGSVSVTQTNPEGCDSTVAINGIIIQPTPVPVIAGSDSVCEYQSYVYSTPFVAGDSYSWSVSGGTILGSSTNNSVTVSWSTTGTGSLTVTQTNPEGCDSTVSLNGIVILPKPTPVLSGNDSVCEYQSYVYSTPNNVGNTYQWVVSGGTILGSSTNNSVTVSWSTTGTGTISVTETSPEGCDSTVANNGIVILPKPTPVIAGSDSVCEYQSYVYSTTNNAGNTYQWAVTGGTILGSSTSNSVTVSWSTNGTGTISVTETSPQGCDSTVSNNGIVILPKPVPVITGNDTTCEYQVYTYTTPFVVGDTYAWSASGGTILGSTTGNSINVRWGATGSGSVTVTQTNSHGCDSTISIPAIVIQPTPVPVLSGSDTVCEYQTYVYSTPNVAGDTYAWAVSGGVIVGATNTNSINVRWNATGTGSVSVTQTNPEGCDSTVAINGIVIQPTPVPFVTGPDTVCAFKTETYSTPFAAGDTYSWNIIGGSILGSSTGTSVDVVWGGNGIGTVSVTQTNPSGCDSTFAINVIQIDSTPLPVITGPDTICEYTTQNYSVDSFSTHTYLWTATGGTIIGPDTNASVVVTWGINGPGTLTIAETNFYDCDSILTINIQIDSIPDPVISGPDTVCAYRTQTYSTANVVGDTYLWTVSGGFIVGDSTNNSVDIRWLAAGTGSVSVTQTNPEGCDTTVSQTGIVIHPSPVPVLTGNDTVCEYQTYNYTTPFVAGDTYSWSISGGVIVGASTGNSVNVRWDATGTGSVSVTQTNPEGCDSTVAINGIVIQPTPVPVLSGSDTVCEYQTYAYSTPNVAGNTYAWAISGGVIVGATNTNTVNVRWNATGIGSVSVTETNPEGCDSTVAINGIVIQPTPVPLVVGPDSVCEYQEFTYSTAFVAGDTYNWVVSGGTLTSGQGTNSITIDWGVNGVIGSVAVTQTNPEGCDSTHSKDVIIINPTPVPVLSGPDSVCEYQTYTYTTPYVAGDTYDWTITGGAIVGPTDTNSVQVRWDSTGVTGDVTVTQTNPEGCDSIVSIPGILIQPTPVPVITGSDTVCEYKITQYSTPAVGGDTYSWSVTGGTIQGSNTNSDVYILWGQSGIGNLTLTQSNGVCDSTVTINVIQIDTTPAPLIVGPDTVCEYKRTLYSVDSLAGHSYQWTVNGGVIVGSSTNPTVEIRWDALGSGDVTIVQTNQYGCDSTVSINNILIQSSPVPVLSGLDTVCEYHYYAYSTPNVVGDTYAWTISGGSIVGPTNTNAVTVLWDSTGTGSISVTQTNPEGCDSTVGIDDVVIQPTPVPVLTGNDTVCEYQTYTYSTPNVVGDTYAWTVFGGTIVGPTNTNSVEIKWDASGSGAVELTQTNPFGCDSTVGIVGIVIQPTPTPNISGNDTVCAYRTTTYSTTNVAGNTYQWTVTGGFIVGSDTSNSVDIRWDGQGNGFVTLTETNPFGCDSTVTSPDSIVIQPSPFPAITGSDSVCEYKIVEYSTPNVVGDTYAWVVSGGTVQGSSTNNNIFVLWGAAGSGSVQLTQTNPEGCDSIVSIPFIQIDSTPVPVIVGPDSVCEYKMDIYSVDSVGGDTYAWTVTGGSIIGPDTLHTITVKWDSAFGSAEVTVVQTNELGCDSTVSISNIQITETPTPEIAGPDSVCEYKIESYGIVNYVLGNEYQWTVTGGTIVGASNGPQAFILWDAASAGSGEIFVTETTPEGCDSTVGYPSVFILPTPTPEIVGPDTVCEYRSYTYTADSVANNTYSWSVTGGTIVGSSTDTAVEVRWAASGLGYVQLVQTNEYGCDSTVFMQNIEIDSTPVPVITGADTVCEYRTQTYSVVAQTGDTYQWTVTGGTIVAGLNTNSIDVFWGATGIGTVNVVQTNTEGCDSSISLNNIVINPTPVPVITGADSVCEYKHHVYTVDSVANHTYFWVVTGGNIIGSNTDTMITVLWDSMGIGTVTVTETNEFDCDSTVSIDTVTISFTPKPLIIGPDSGCEYEYSIYQVTEDPANTYSWVVTGGTIIGSADTSRILINWGPAGTGTVTLVETSPLGCDSTVSRANIVISPTPVPVIDGLDSVCAFKPQNYSVTVTPGHTYQWSITGGVIIGPDFNPVVTVRWGGVGTGEIQVVQTNPQGCDSIDSMSITVVPTPEPVISGPNPVCAYRSYTYTVPAVPNNTYSWSTTGGNIVGASDSNVVTIRWAAEGPGTVTVIQTNEFGCDSTVQLPIVIQRTPFPEIFGNPTDCERETRSYFVNQIPGNTYQWSVSNGTIITSTTGTSVTVEWGNAGIGILSVTETTPTGCDSTLDFTVTLNPKPVLVIDGPTSGCAFGPTSYKINASPGDIIQWRIPGGGGFILNNGQNQDSMSVQWDNVDSAIVFVTVTNNFGCVDSTDTVVRINPTPTPNIQGPTDVCEGDTVRYSTAIVGNNFNWSVSGGGIIVGSNINGFVDVYWPTQTFGTVTVIESTTLGCDSVDIFNTTVHPKPRPRISGKDVGCKDDIGVPYNYNTPPVANRTYFWTVSSGGQISSGQGTTNIRINWLSPGEHYITLTETNTITGCDSTVMDTIQVDSVPTSTADVTPGAACTPARLFFQVPEESYDPNFIYEWIFSDGTKIRDHDFSIYYKDPITDTVRLIITDPSTTCADTSTQTTFYLWPLPNAEFTHSKYGDTIYGGEDIVKFTDMSFGEYDITQWDWDFGDGGTSTEQNPTYEYQVEGELVARLIVTDENGCKDTAFRTAITRLRPKIFAPNALSPDGDGINETYKIATHNVSPDGFTVQIYNRWGELLYESHDLHFEWDGSYMGVYVENEVYVVIITARSVTGIPLKLKSTVTVIR